LGLSAPTLSNGDVTPRLGVTHPLLECDALVLGQSGDGFVKGAPYSLMLPLKQRRERERGEREEEREIDTDINFSSLWL